MFQIHITCRCFFVGVDPTRNKTMGSPEKGRKFRARKSRRSHHPGVFVGQLLSQGWHIQNRPHFEREELWIIYFSKEVASICWYRIYTPNQNYVACENVIKKTTKKKLSSKGPRHDRNDATKKNNKKKMEFQKLLQHIFHHIYPLPNTPWYISQLLAVFQTPPANRIALPLQRSRFMAALNALSHLGCDKHLRNSTTKVAKTDRFSKKYCSCEVAALAYRLSDFTKHTRVFTRTTQKNGNPHGFQHTEP